MKDNIIKGKFPVKGRRKRAIRAQDQHVGTAELVDQEASFSSYSEVEPHYEFSPIKRSFKQRAYEAIKAELDVTQLILPMILIALAATGAFVIYTNEDMLAGGFVAVAAQWLLMAAALHQVVTICIRCLLIPCMIFALAFAMTKGVYTLPIEHPELLICGQLVVIAAIIGFFARCLNQNWVRVR